MPWIYKPKRNYKNQQNRNKRQDIYNTPLWKGMRLAKLMNQPLCEVCLLEGKTTLADHVHHLISFMDAQDQLEKERLAYDGDNLCSICQECHNKIHNGCLKGCKSLTEIRKRLELLT